MTVRNANLLDMHKYISSNLRPLDTGQLITWVTFHYFLFLDFFNSGVCISNYHYTWIVILYSVSRIVMMGDKQWGKLDIAKIFNSVWLSKRNMGCLLLREWEDSLPGPWRPGLEALMLRPRLPWTAVSGCVEWPAVILVYLYLVSKKGCTFPRTPLLPPTKDRYCNDLMLCIIIIIIIILIDCSNSLSSVIEKWSSNPCVIFTLLN